MKKGWVYKELGELCHKFNGLWKGKKAPFVRVGVIRNANFTKAFTLDFSNIEYLDVEEKQYASRKLQLGDLIVEKSGGSEKQPVGRAVLFQEKEGEYSFSNFTSVLRVKDNHEITPEFLYKYILHVYLRGDTRKMQKATTGIHNIEFDKYLAIKIPIPPLSEQKEIVEYLDSSFAKIDKLKENAAKNLEEAKALFQSALKDALEPKEGWEEKTLKELTNKISDGSHNPPTGLSYSKYRMLSSKNVRNDNFSFDNPRYLSEDDFQKENKRTQLEKGDVLLTIVGAGLGDCCVYNFDDVIVFQRSVSVLKPNYDKITSRFLMYSLQFRYDDIRKKSNGAAQKGIYLKQLAAYSLKLPSIKEQQSIVSFLDSLNEKVNTLQQNYSRICNECDALKQAILRQVFE